MPVDQPPVMRFRAIADADPSALVCVLERLQAHNLVPKTVQAYRLGHKFIEMKIEVDDLSHESFRRMLSKIDEMPMVVAAVAFDVDWPHTVTCT
jgi:hypothetical protein